MKFVWCLLLSGCGDAGQEAQIDATPEAAVVAAAPEKTPMPPLILRCVGEINGEQVHYEARRLPSGTLIHGAVGTTEASQVTQRAALWAHRVGLLVESDPPTFLRAEPIENGMRLRAAQLAAVWHFACWAP